jgi:hypothetical protein
MNRVFVASCAILSVLLLDGCATEQPTPAARAMAEPQKTTAAARAMPMEPQKLKLVTTEFLNQLLDWTKFREALYTDPIDDCPIVDNVCTIDIQLITVSDVSGTYCVGLLPRYVRLTKTQSSNPTKRIVWNLLPPDPPVANADFFFYDEDDHGITWLTNIQSSLPWQREFHTGRLGDGGSGATAKTKFSVMNRHRVKGDAVYVPIVLKRDTVKNEISLCGTPDPRMVND